MKDDFDTHKIELGGGLEFRFYGPQGESLVYFGTVGEDPDYSNDLLRRFCEQFCDKEVGENVFADQVTCLATSSSPWVLLQFPESRREQIIEQLREFSGAS